MTDMTSTVPLWLANVRDSQRVIAEGIEAERIKREAADAAKELKERERKLVQFETSLRAVLGDEPANELLGGPYAQVKELFILSGDYKFSYSEPIYHNASRFDSSDKSAYLPAIIVSRPVPKEVQDYLNDRDLWCPEEITPNPCRAASVVGVTTIIGECDKEFSRIMAKYDEEKKREAERMAWKEKADATPVEPAKPELDPDTKAYIAYIDHLRSALEQGFDLTRDQRLLVAFINYFQTSMDW